MFILAIPACATTPSVVGPSLPPDLAWQARKSKLEKFTSWRMNARIAVKGKHDSWSASVDWRQQDDAFDIRFMTYLGQTVAHLQGDHGRVTLHTSDEEISGTNVDIMLRKHFGWAVPVEGLRYWILGLPVPYLVEHRKLDEHGRLAWLEQSGWHIEYIRYGWNGDVEMPEKMVLEYPPLRVRLVIDRWTGNADVTSEGVDQNNILRSSVAK
jgi:outer membrane lipoprotein LolB